VKSRRTRRFRDLLEALPGDTRRQAYAAYRLFKRDPFHPSLHFKRISPTVYSVRIGLDYRALGRREADDLIVWFWIGPHSEYDQLVSRR
jgi:hypothetical protein